MSPEKQRIAIAEAVGWKENGLGPEGTLHHPKHCTCFDGNGCKIPDYLNDLNAMHEALHTLTYTQAWDFLHHLGSTLGYANRNEWDYWSFTTTTAAQLAGAFLKTIGKWEDE